MWSGKQRMPSDVVGMRGGGVKGKSSGSGTAERSPHWEHEQRARTETTQRQRLRLGGANLPAAR